MNDLVFHLPVLQVVVPLLAAPLCFLLRNETLVRVFTISVSFACFGIATTLLRSVLDGHVLIYQFGGWARPYGIEYRVDILNAFVLVVVSAVTAVVFSAVGVSRVGAWLIRLLLCCLRSLPVGRQ